MKRKKLHGIFTPNMVPLDEQGRINERELRRMVDWLIAKGINGLYPNGSTGEFTRFSFDERKEIVRIVCDQNAGRVFVLAGAAEANVDMTLEAASYYHTLGADAVAIVAPFYFPLSQEGVYAYFAELASQSPIDLTLYNIPQFANDIAHDTIMRLAAEFPRIVGIKDSSRDLPRFLNMMNEIRPIRPDFVFLSGCGEMVVPTLLMGGDGATVATSGVVPEAFAALYKLACSGDWATARDLQFRLLKLTKLILFGADFPEAIRQAVGIRGFAMGEGRQPLSATQRYNLGDITREVQCVLNTLGVSDAPAGGCPVESSLLPRDSVEVIVQEVVRKLREAKHL